ncbi:GH23663 [Drosophila grimshawi]|uniref:GH23663 n=1 Tax=Drosophila grimshawi TaxID=7222 RepID=B4K2H8_DROGR|nr:GH23663 [Drosophila grimshawi]
MTTTTATTTTMATTTTTTMATTTTMSSYEREHRTERTNGGQRLTNDLLAAMGMEMGMGKAIAER